MKRILRYNESTSSVEHLLPGDGSYKRIGHSDYERIEYTFSYVSTPESQKFIIDSLQSLYNKLSAIEDCHARLRHNAVSYNTHLFSDVFVDIKLRSEDWYIINIQLRDDVVIIIADGEFGVQQFIDNFNPDNPYIKSNSLNESINFPSDGNYIKINHEDHKYIVSQYEINYKHDASVGYFNLIYNKLNELGLTPIPNYSKDFISVEYQGKTFQFKIIPRKDNWVVILFKTNSNLYYDFYLCDDEEGVSKFINDFKPNEHLNESISFPEDEGYIEIDHEEFTQFVDQYASYHSILSVEDIQKQMYAKLRTMDFYPLSHGNDNLIFDYRRNRFNITISTRDDDWILMIIGCNSDIHFYICDGISGVTKFINEFDPSKYPGYVNEAINYPKDGSFSKLDYDTSYTEFLLQYNQELDRDIEKKYVDLLHSYFFKNNLPVTKYNDTIQVNTTNYVNSVSVSSYSDEWVLVICYQGSFLCDQLEGFQAFLDSDILLGPVEVNQVNESVENDIEEDSYDEATLDDYIYMWKRYKPCDFEQYEIQELKDALEAKLSVNVFPEKEFTISMYSRSERVLFTINKMNDGWILVKTDDDNYYVCDQVAGLIKFMDV